jgi:hypothetical protein
VLYQSQFGQISTVSPTQGRLEIHAPPHGVIAIAGPQARELCLALESQRATMIRTDKLGLTSVVRLSEQQYALQKIEAATPASNAEPDLDELD